MLKTLSALLVKPVFAQNIPLTPVGPFGVLANLTVDKLVSGAISLVLVLVSLVFFFILVLGGLKWITSEGDEKRVGAARAQITNGLIGLAIIFAAWAILTLIGRLFGINLLNLEIKPF
jgi:hypothetical protein